jgi:aryl-alcohol dehydrogenase-like predicted oxidoreductase
MLPTRNVALAGRRVTVTRLGLGLAALGRPGYINLGHAGDLSGSGDVEGLRGRAWEVLDAALAAGIGCFDAARSYGLAEQFLAGWLKALGIAPGRLFVSSKWGYRYTADWQADAEVHEVKEHSLAQYRRQREETRALLGDHLDLYQVHSATLDSGLFEQPALLAALAELRAEGVAVGLSVSGPSQGETIRRALAVEIDGRPLFEAVQATWNLLEHSAGGALAEAKAAGRLVIVKEALANGRLTARGGVQALLAEAERRRTAPDALALAAVLAQPWADVVLSGASTTAQLASNLAAAALTVEEELLAEMAEAPALYWKTRAALPWT